MNVGYQASLAAKTLLANASPALTTVTHFYAEMEDPNAGDNNTAETRQHPCVICFFSDAQEYPIQTGNYNGKLSIQLEVSSEDHTAEEAEAMFDDVWGCIYTDDIISRLSAAITDFTAFGFTGGVQQTQQTINGRYRVKSMVLPINCCASDVS